MPGKGKKTRDQRLEELLESHALVDELERMPVLNEGNDGELFTAFFNVSTDLCGISDLETGNILDVNPAWLSTFGWKREEVIGRTGMDLGLRKDKADLDDFSSELKKKGHVRAYRTTFYTRIGEPRTCLLDTTIVESLGVKRLLTSSKDITEQEELAQALQEEQANKIEELRTSGKLFENAFKLSKDLCAITDIATGKLVDVNPKWLSTFGWTREEAIGKTTIELNLWESLPERTELNETYSVDKPLKDYKTNFLTKRGDVRTCLVDTAFVEVDGELTLFTSSTDITDKEEMEQERLKLAKLESIGTIAGGIAHDLNNMLTGILGNLSLARLSDDRQDRADFLKKAENASVGVKDLTLQLLTFAKGGSPVVEAVDLGRLLHDVLGFILHGASVASRLEIADELWVVNVDKGQINQVVSNLIINAEQAMTDSGTIIVSAENVQLESDSGLPLKPGSYVQVSVADQGEGIPEEVQAKMFDPFFTTKNEGSGLGLATSLSIVQKHGGHISVASQIGKGSKFEFYLPVSTSKSAIDNAVDEAELIQGEGKILVMDDVDLIRTMTETMLKKLGFGVVTCRDGDEALRLYASALGTDRPFHAVIMDLTIPGGMGGQETIERLKLIDPQVKAIVASGYSDDTIMANFVDYGFSGSIAKPYRIEEVSRVLNSVVGSS